MNVARNILEELKAERNSLDPSFIHCIRLLDEEINKLSSNDPNEAQKEKIFISMEDQKKYNLIGRLLGPKGLTLKQIQADTGTKMSILGRGSVKDAVKEEEMRTSGKPIYEHLKEDLHVLVEAVPPAALYKLAAGVAEIRKMLIPPEHGQPDYSLKYSNSPGTHSSNREREHSDVHVSSSRSQSKDSMRPYSSIDDRYSWKETRSSDNWRNNAVFKDYNHGSSGIDDAEPYDGGNSYTNMDDNRYGYDNSRYGGVYGSRYSAGATDVNFSTGRGDSEPKSSDVYGGPRPRHTVSGIDSGGHRRDYRHHPYMSGPPRSRHDMYY